MGLLDRVSANVGMAAPRLRVVQDREPKKGDARTERPETLETFIGQESVTFNLAVECQDATDSKRLPDHILLEGPPGLGKTSLAQCVANRLGARFVEIPATALDKVNEVAKALATIGEPEDGPCVVFVDEIHGVCKKGQLLMLSALEDGWFQPSGATEPYVLAPFCMIGATTNPGLLSRPMRERFGIRETLEYYEDAEIAEIIQRYADKTETQLSEGVADSVAAVSRQTPRIATSLLRRVAVFSRVAGEDRLTVEGVREIFERLGIDQYGLDKQDRALLKALCGQTRPVGLRTLATLLGTDEDAVTQREPYLLRAGVLRQDGRGRIATKKGYRAVGKLAPVWTP